jgi:hypothetical protein
MVPSSIEQAQEGTNLGAKRQMPIIRRGEGIFHTTAASAQGMGCLKPCDNDLVQHT